MLTSVFSLQRFFKMLISCYCVIKKSRGWHRCCCCCWHHTHAIKSIIHLFFSTRTFFLILHRVAGTFPGTRRARDGRKAGQVCRSSQRRQTDTFTPFFGRFADAAWRKKTEHMEEIHTCRKDRKLLMGRTEDWWIKSIFGNNKRLIFQKKTAYVPVC